MKCKQCGHENDLTRVFCQNCGTRLERAEGAAGPTISGPTKVPTGPRKLKRSGVFGPALARVVRAVISTAILGALIAMLIQMSRQPEGLPPAQAANEAQAAQVYQMIVSLADNPYGRGYDLSQDQINNYLAARIVPGPAPEGASFRAQFQRAFVVVEKGELAFFIEQKFLGFPVYMYVTGTLEKSGAATVFKSNGGGVGHVRFNSRLVPLLEKVIAPVAASVADATTIVQSASSIALEPGVVKLSWLGKKPAGQ